jgi:hypothetical protein
VVVYWLNEETNEWIRLDNISVDLTDGTVSGDVEHFTKFAVITEEKKDEVQIPAIKLFADITGHWAEKSILALTSKGAVNGYPDDSFKPNNNITRAEFASILVNALDLKGTSSNIFNDTTSHWAKEAISIAKANGIISGFADGTFKPNEFITREQMSMMVVNAFKLEVRTSTHTFADQSDISDWASSSMHTAIEHEIILGSIDNKLNPRANATRAEAVTVIVRAVDKMIK